MSKKFIEIKDALYYSDMMYELRKIAKFEQESDEMIEQRIAKRQEDIAENQTTGPYSVSVFQLEIFEIIRGISKKAGVSFKGIGAISKYPELVTEALVELENKKNSLSAPDMENSKQGKAWDNVMYTDEEIHQYMQIPETSPAPLILETIFGENEPVEEPRGPRLVRKRNQKESGNN